MKSCLHALDNLHFASMKLFLRGKEFREAYSKMAASTKRSSLLTRFLARLRLPLLGTPPRNLPRRLWGSNPTSTANTPVRDSTSHSSLARELEKRLESRWKKDTERIGMISARLASFLGGPIGVSLRDLQFKWIVDRFEIRSDFWVGRSVQSTIAALYSSRRANFVVGGPPCQGFSRPGRAKLGSLGEKGSLAFVDEEFGDERNRLYQHYLLFLSALDPDVFLFENVNTFKATVSTETNGQVSVEKALEEDIRAMKGPGNGFRIASGIVNAADCLVPQRRLRYFLVGCSERVPDAGGAESLFDGLATNGNLKGMIVRSQVAFSGLGKVRWKGMSGTTRLSGPDPADGLPALESEFAGWLRKDTGGRLVHRADGHVARKPTPDDAEFFRGLKPGVRWKDIDDVERILRKINPEHHLLRPRYLRKGESNHGDWLARLDAQEVSRTICAHLSKDGYAYIHPTQARTISVREAARIQSFPDWFSFRGIPMGQSYRMIGNAVPPLMAKRLADAILTLLGSRNVAAL
jgi:site-specific DNA-cytosine methylase